MSKYILITGATGFIGKVLIHELVSCGYQCRIIVRKPDLDLSKLIQPEDIFTGSFEDSVNNDLIFKQVHTVIHLLARVHQMNETAVNTLSEYQRINTHYTTLLAKRSLSCGVKQFIFFSSVKVMGDFEATGKIITENDRPEPSEPYGLSKYEAEKELAKLFAHQKESRCIILRLPMVYGPGNKGNMVSLLKAARKKISLPLAGALGKRSMIYSGNICSAVRALLQSSEAAHSSLNTFFLTDGIDYSSAELYSCIFQAMHRKTGIFYIPGIIFKILGFMNKDIQSRLSRLFNDFRFSSDAFQKAYQWKPSFTLSEGIKETVSWYMKNHI